MAINPYDQAIWSTYTPLSGNDILRPALMMRERHDKLEDEYGALSDITQQLSHIAQSEPDPRVKEKYDNYMAQIEAGVNTLSEKGITPNSRKQMLALRSKFQSEMLPLKMGYELKLQDINAFNQKRMQDPTWIGPNPNDRSVMDYVNNGLMPMSVEGMSGAMIAQQSAEMAKPFANILNSSNPTELMVDQFGPQYQEFMRGYSPEEDEYKIAADFISNVIMQSNSNNFGWATDAYGNINPQLANQIKGYIDQGLTQMIGKSEILRDTGRDFKLQMQIAREAAKSDSSNSYQWGLHKNESINLPHKDQEKTKKTLERQARGKSTLIEDSTEKLYNAFNLTNMMSHPSRVDRSEWPVVEENLKKFENGELTKKELKDSIGKYYGAYPEKIDEYIESVEQDPTRLYEEWEKANPGRTQDEFIAEFLDEYDAKTTWGNTSRTIKDNEAQTFLRNTAESVILGAPNRQDIIIKNDKGKVIKPDKKFSKEDISKATYKGLNFYNPETNTPTRDYVYYKDNKSYTINVPIYEEEIESIALQPYGDVVREISKPMTSDRHIMVTNPNTGESIKYNIKKVFRGDFYLQNNDNPEEIIYLNDILNMAMQNIEGAVKKGSGK